MWLWDSKRRSFLVAHESLEFRYFFLLSSSFSVYFTNLIKPHKYFTNLIKTSQKIFYEFNKKPHEKWPPLAFKHFSICTGILFTNDWHNIIEILPHSSCKSFSNSALLLIGFDDNRLSIMLHNSSTTFKSGLLGDGIWRILLFVFFQLFSLKPSFGGEDRL